MPYRRQVTASLFNPAVLLPALMSLMLFSCLAPKKHQYQKYKPFVYKTRIKLVESKLRRDEKQALLARLYNQLDDSLQVRVVSSWMIFKRISYPATFDSLYIARSITFMNSLLNSIGYYSPGIKYSVKTDTAHHDQYRVTTSFQVTPGKQVTFDSIAYDLETPALQELVMKSKNESLLKKGQPYSKQVLVDEINRIVDTLRNNGYYKFSREDLYVEHDTVVAALIDPTLDPLQQAALLEQLNKRRENPTINVSVKQRPVRDSSHLTKYYIGKVTVFPDLPITEDTAVTVKNDTTNIRRVDVITRSNKFRLPFIVNNIFLRPGRLYRQENYYRTSNRLGQFSAWQYYNIDFDDSELADSLVDITVRMYPAKKQNMDVSLEASRNTTDIVTTSNLFGVGVNLGLQNRNAYRQSVRTTTALRTGVELGGHFIQTTQVGLSHTIAFPRLITPFPIRREGRLKNMQSVLNLSATFTDRRQFYTLRSIAGSWGYQWTRGNKTYIVKFPNVEYATLTKTDSLNNILKTNPSLQLAFRTGLVIGEQFGYTSIRQRDNKTNVFRFSVEESGAWAGLITSLDKGPLFRFLKGDIEFVHNINYGKTQLVMRAYAGAGIPYGKQGDTAHEQTLPFYKAFWAGGPNSMRAWGVRRLGLGSSKFYSDPRYNTLDRFGDIQLEGNIEYRFLLGTVYGVKLRSALYMDAGNIWDRKPIDTSAEAQGSDFQLNRFFKEFAVGAGTGLRLDFSYFTIRLDWAYKIRDPQRIEYSNRWFYDMKLLDGQFQLGINYPF